jgi:DNA-binding NtrC family response regulator
MDKRYSLLFVDNEEKALRAFSSAFRRDYDVYFAATEFDALEILSYQPVDIIVCDQYLPDMPGDELLELIHQQYPHIVQLLLVDAIDRKILIDTPYSKNIFDIVAKPWGFESLKVLIDNASQQSAPPVLNKQPEMSQIEEADLVSSEFERPERDIDKPPVARRILDSVVVSRLPAVKAKPLKLTAGLDPMAARPSDDSEEKKTAILLMDKDQRVRNSIRAISKRFGFEVYTVGSYVQAASTFAIRPDIGVAIVGISIDMRDTMESLRLFKQHCSDLSVIALADMSDAATAIKLINEGKVFRYLQKPVTPQEFDAAVIAGIKRHRMLKKVGALGDRYREEGQEMITKSGMKKLKELLKNSA